MTPWELLQQVAADPAVQREVARWLDDVTAKPIDPEQHPALARPKDAR